MSEIKTEKLKVFFKEHEKIEQANLLVIGAGGIGCELMKCLSLVGFTKASLVNQILTAGGPGHDRCDQLEPPVSVQTRAR